MAAMRARPFALAALLVLSGLLAACGEEEDSTKAGDVIQARLDDQFEDGEGASVTLPTGRLLIRSAEPVDGAGADETRSREAVGAPAGTVLVPITWQYDTWASDRMDGILAPRTTPKIDLVSGSERYRLPPPQREAESGESFYVVVEGDGAERSLEIDFDGVVQSIDLATGRRDKGDAEGLYGIKDAKLKRRTCGEEDWFNKDKPTDRVNAEFSCSLIGPVLTPYAAGEWAPDGSVWLALTLSTEMRAYGRANGQGGTALYVATKVKVDPEIDGEDAIYALSTEDGADECPSRPEQYCGWAKHLVFQVPIDDAEQGPLDLEISYRLALANEWGDWAPPQRDKATADESFKLWDDVRKKKKKNRD